MSTAPTGLLGVLLLPLLALALSAHRRRVPWRTVLGGIALQALLAYTLLAFPPAVRAFELLAALVNRVIGASDAGIRFLFGSLADPGGPWGFTFVVRVLPVIVFFASLMGVLYHLRVMQTLIAALAWLLRRTLRVTGTEAMVVAANVFVGQTEAPLCVRPYIERMTRAQLMTLMVGGFATIAGSVLAAIVGMLGPDFTRHLICASVMSAPAAFVMAKILEPETAEPIDAGLRDASGSPAANVLDAAAHGATDGLKLALNVAAMLVAFVSLLALVNIALAGAGSWFGFPDLTLQRILGTVLAPLAFCLGIPFAESSAVGSLLGQKLILTEFVAYTALAQQQTDAATALSPRSAAIAAYALCGFANFPSIAIQIGGLSALAESRRAEFASLALRAMIGGALASFQTAAIASLFL